MSVQLGKFLENPVVSLAIGFIILVLGGIVSINNRSVPGILGTAIVIAWALLSFAIFRVDALNVTVKFGSTVTLAGLAIIGLSLVGSATAVDPIEEARELAHTEAVLVPAHVDTPELRSIANPHDLVIWVGGNYGVYSPKSDAPHVLLRVKGKNVVWLNSDPRNEGLSVSANIHDGDGNTIASIDDNKFQKVGFAHFVRPDRSTLMVLDQKDLPLFKVEFLNPLTIRITGLMYGPDGTILSLSDSETIYGQTTFEKNGGRNVSVLASFGDEGMSFGTDK